MELFSEINQFFISFCCQKDSKSFIFQILEKIVKTLYQYWQFYGKEWPIMHDITNKLFTMGTSSAALERNLSKMGFIQKKIEQQTQYRICGESGVSKDQCEHVIRLFLLIFTDDRGR